MKLQMAMSLRDRCPRCGGELLDVTTESDQLTVRTYECRQCGRRELRTWDETAESWTSAEQD
jgi:uncharacterized protein with PIN domain